MKENLKNRQRHNTSRHALSYLFTTVILTLSIAIAQQSEPVKLAQTSMQFLSVISDARAAAVAGAVTNVSIGSSSLFFNPAMLSQMNGYVDASFSNNQWIADIKHQTASVAVKPYNGDYGVIGFSLQNVDYGEFLYTRAANNANGYEDIPSGELSKPTAIAVGVGYAKSISSQFSVGGQIRWVRQSLGNAYIDTNRSKREYALTPIVFDFGTSFKTGFRSLMFGMTVRNFSKEMKYEADLVQLPLVFTIGLSMDVMDFMEDRSVLRSVILSTDASHFRDHAEQLFLGTEWNVLDMVMVRAGYITAADEESFTYGVGFSQFGVSVDYAFTPYTVFDDVQRFSVRFNF